MHVVAEPAIFTCTLDSSWIVYPSLLPEKGVGPGNTESGKLLVSTSCTIWAPAWLGGVEHDCITPRAHVPCSAALAIQQHKYLLC